MATASKYVVSEWDMQGNSSTTENFQPASDKAWHFKRLVVQGNIGNSNFWDFAIIRCHIDGNTENVLDLQQSVYTEVEGSTGSGTSGWFREDNKPLIFRNDAYLKVFWDSTTNAFGTTGDIGMVVFMGIEVDV